jgi:hypothetical protein
VSGIDIVLVEAVGVPISQAAAVDQIGGLDAGVAAAGLYGFRRNRLACRQGCSLVPFDPNLSGQDPERSTQLDGCDVRLDNVFGLRPPERAGAASAVLET